MIPNNFALRSWLTEDAHRLVDNEGAGPLQYVPKAKLFAWVDENIEVHGYWLAQVLPKTLDKSVGGRLTRDFMARYDGKEGISASLACRFHAHSWFGCLWGNIVFMARTKRRI